MNTNTGFSLTSFFSSCSPYSRRKHQKQKQPPPNLASTSSPLSPITTSQNVTV